MEIYIKDTNPNSISAGGALEDVSQVEKFEMSAEDYAKMENSLAAKRREREERQVHFVFFVF